MQIDTPGSTPAGEQPSPAATPPAGQREQQAAKPWWQSKTLIVNAAVLGLAAAETQLQVIKPLLGVEIYPALAFGLPVVNAVLRLTSQAIGTSRS